jgi:hypothetical protein
MRDWLPQHEGQTMKSFKKYFLITAFAAIAGLTGCESKADRERKPAVAQPMIEASIQTEGNVDAGYAARLRTVLMHTDTKDLETLKDHGITVCLDQRLSQQKHGFWDTEIRGVYYVQDKIVTLYDNGDHGAATLSYLANALCHNNIPSDARVWLAGVYSNGRSVYTQWRSLEDFDDSSIAKNPQLLTPPVKTVTSSIKPATPAL